MAVIISKLPEQEKKALALCGISQDSQLMQVNIETLLTDLHQAQQFFPEEASALTDARVREIYVMVCGTRALQKPTEEELRQIREEDAKEEQEPKSEPEQGDAPVATALESMPTRAVPDLAPRRHQHRKRSAAMTPEQMKAAPGIAHSVHCNRPISTYVAAVSMVLFYVGLALAFLVPPLVYISVIEKTNIYIYFILAVVFMVPYAFHGAWVSCAVCNMKFFMLRHYNINRHAHKIPVLEWTTLLTALHIIFLLWYRCPACGTSLRLYRHRH